jgi:hypothetical protein
MVCPLSPCRRGELDVPLRRDFRARSGVGKRPDVVCVACLRPAGLEPDRLSGSQHSARRRARRSRAVRGWHDNRARGAGHGLYRPRATDAGNRMGSRRSSVVLDQRYGLYARYHSSRVTVQHVKRFARISVGEEQRDNPLAPFRSATSPTWLTGRARSPGCSGTGG